MVNEKRLIDAKAFHMRVAEGKMTDIFPDWKELPEEVQDMVCKHGQYLEMLLETQPTVDAVEVPCRCCDCYYLLNGKNSFGLYFFCGYQNGLKNLKNTEKDFCMYGKRRYENETESDA